MYCLKYKDDVVLEFDTEARTIKMINERLLPLSLVYKERNYDLVRKFCSDRILMLNRNYCKELLLACGIESQDDVTICIVCKGLSFRDNYWISELGSMETWQDVNLYSNSFSTLVSKVALTGDMSEITVVDDRLFTGELTNKGTRAKCFIRKKDGLYLYKNETIPEIASEIITYYIAQLLRLPCSKYTIERLYDKDCSVCKILTSEQYELLPCRDVMSMYNSKMSWDSDYYRAFMQICSQNFMRMQILDYVTLNTDRNRDNFGLLRYNGNIINLYPVYDHDSCFKGKSVEATYFPTGLSFKDTLNLLKTQYGAIYNSLSNDIFKLTSTVKEEPFKRLFLKYKSLEEYNAMLERISNL